MDFETQEAALLRLALRSWTNRSPPCRMRWQSPVRDVVPWHGTTAVETAKAACDCGRLYIDCLCAGKVSSFNRFSLQHLTMAISRALRAVFLTLATLNLVNAYIIDKACQPYYGNIMDAIDEALAIAEYAGWRIANDASGIDAFRKQMLGDNQKAIDEFTCTSSPRFCEPLMVE